MCAISPPRGLAMPPKKRKSSESSLSVRSPHLLLAAQALSWLTLPPRAITGIRLYDLMGARPWRRAWRLESRVWRWASFPLAFACTPLTRPALCCGPHARNRCTDSRERGFEGPPVACLCAQSSANPFGGLVFSLLPHALTPRQMQRSISVSFQSTSRPSTHSRLLLGPLRRDVFLELLRHVFSVVFVFLHLFLPVWRHSCRLSARSESRTRKKPSKMHFKNCLERQEIALCVVCRE